VNIRILISILLISCCSHESISQGWLVKHDYPLEFPGFVRYAQCPDSLLQMYKAAEEETLEQVMSWSERFEAQPKTIKLEKGEIYWLKGEFVNSQDSEVQFLAEAGFMWWKWSEVDIYLVDQNQSIEHIRLGTGIRPTDRSIRDGRNFFWLNLAPHESKKFFIRFKSSVQWRRASPSIRIYDKNTFQEFEGFTLKKLGGVKTDVYWRWPIKKMNFIFHNREYVIDSMNHYSFAEIKENWDHLARYYQPKYLTKASKSMVWCRLKIVNPKDIRQQYLLDAGGDNPTIEAFLPEVNGTYKKVLTGKKVPMLDKQVRHPMSLLSFDLPANDTAYLYLKYYPFETFRGHYQPTYGIAMGYFDQNELFDQTRKLGIWKGFLLGIFIFQFIYFSLRAGLERDAQGGYYALFIFGISMLFLYVENVRNTFIAWQLAYDFNPAFYLLSYTLGALGLYLFSNRFLRLKKKINWIWKIQTFNLVMIFIMQCILFIQEITGTYGTPIFFQLSTETLSSFFIGCFLLFCVIGAIIGVILGHRGFKSYLIAFSPFYLAGSIIMIESLYVGLPSNLKVNVIYICIVLTNILFAIVVAGRNNASKLKELQAQGLIQLNKAKSRFYDHISHEFRTPLTVIKGVSNLIQGHEKEKNLIQKNSQQVLNLVDQLIGFSKAQSDLDQLKTVEENVVPYLEYLLEAFQPLADQKEIRLNACYENQVMEIAYDREKLKLIVNNLLSNAIKFTSEGGEVTLKASFKPPFFNIEVKDNGIGISKEDIPKVFDRYFQVSDTKPSNGETGGIGLALTRELVERMGGNIQVKSSKGEGSIFTISLPVQAKMLHESNELQDKLADSEKDLPMLLLVEDHEDVIYYLERLLSADYRIVTATNGIEGFEKATSLIPDLIVSDVMMPEMDGYEMTSRLKADIRTSHVPVILLTAKSKHEEKIMGLKGGADAYLVKPFEEDELKVRIENLIESRNNLRRIYSNGTVFKSSKGRVDPFIEAAVKVLEEHFEDGAFGINEFADAMHLSRMQVHRKLRAITGGSTSHFINLFRLEKGKTFLQSGELNVSEVAYECGYSDPGYFSKLFTKQYGASPQQFQHSDKS